MIDESIITISNLTSYNEKIQKLIGDNYDCLDKKIFIGTTAEYAEVADKIPNGAIVIFTDETKEEVIAEQQAQAQSNIDELFSDDPENTIEPEPNEDIDSLFD